LNKNLIRKKVEERQRPVELRLILGTFPATEEDENEFTRAPMTDQKAQAHPNIEKMAEKHRRE